MDISLEQFKEITGVDIGAFFQDYTTLVNSYYAAIIAYYEGGDLPGDGFRLVDQLLKQSEAIETAFYDHNNELNLLVFWELLDNFEEIKTSLLSIKNTGKWMRSSKVGTYDSTFYLQRTLSDYENFEDVARSVGSADPQNDWENITVRNLINEEDYSAEQGGPMFKISFAPTANFSIQTVVDHLIGERILGKDIDKKFHFANNDVAVVEYGDAIEQTVDTIISTLKGDIPEFPEDGISNDVIGTSVAVIQYPTLFRNLSAMFSKDDRFKEINLLSLEQKDDYVMMNINVVTVTNDSYLTNISI